LAGLLLANPTGVAAQTLSLSPRGAGSPAPAAEMNTDTEIDAGSNKNTDFTPADSLGLDPKSSEKVLNPSLSDALEHVVKGPKEWTSPRGLASSLKIMLLLTVLSVAPAILLMTTSFIRVLIVLGLLRQALGTQQLPPSQVITSLALFITLLIMTPVWTDVYENAIVPYRNNEIEWDEAWKRAKRPIANFMGHQIEQAQNTGDVWMLYDYYSEASGKLSADEPSEYEEMPVQVLIPAYVLSELKTAFLIGFQIYLPFLVLDIVISSVTISMGMLMLPPVMISLPFKIMLFVLVDGWRLVVSMLLNSFGAYW